MKTLSLRLSDDLHQRCQVECERLGISLNALVAVALDAYLSRNKVSGIEEMPLEAFKRPSDGFCNQLHGEVSTPQKKTPETPKKGITWPPMMKSAGKRKTKRR